MQTIYTFNISDFIWEKHQGVIVGNFYSLMKVPTPVKPPLRIEVVGKTKTVSFHYQRTEDDNRKHVYYPSAWTQCDVDLELIY